MQVNPQNLSGGDYVFLVICERPFFGTLKWVDNEKGMASIKFEDSNGCTIESIRRFTHVQKGKEDNRGLDKGEPTFPVNPENIKLGDLVWSSTGPGIVVKMDEDKGQLTLDTEYVHPIRSITRSADSSDPQKEEKLQVLRGVYKQFGG